MIVLYSNQKIELQTKAQLAAESCFTVLGSDFYDTITKPWFGDLLTVQSLFPEWILKSYETDTTSSVTIVPIIKNYLRWLFSQDYGYGAQLNWENIRVPLYMHSLFLEALFDFYFPNANLSSSQLSSILPNLRIFSIKADENYFNIKGTPPAIKYLICALLGFGITEVYVTTTTYSNIQIAVTSSKYDTLQTYKTFLEQHVIPAGIVIDYKVI